MDIHGRVLREAALDFIVEPAVMSAVLRVRRAVHVFTTRRASMLVGQCGPVAQQDTMEHAGIIMAPRGKCHICNLRAAQTILEALRARYGTL